MHRLLITDQKLKGQNAGFSAVQWWRWCYSSV